MSKFFTDHHIVEDNFFHLRTLFVKPTVQSIEKYMNVIDIIFNSPSRSYRYIFYKPLSTEPPEFVRAIKLKYPLTTGNMTQGFVILRNYPK